MSVETLPSGNYRVEWRDENGVKQRQWFPKGHKAEAIAFDGRMKMLKLQGGLEAFTADRQTLAEYHDGPWIDHLATLEPNNEQGLRADLAQSRRAAPRQGAAARSARRARARVRRHA